ncbi:hypothetical protein AVEN_119966-1 [Araneus ventricosus]|uniref:Uncharacterized protein n=1 Tax=Araneus ventricosus TaxID=182803 RepID=A0A4Y1ZRG7_ARAVE|nr:hypothetical protein AVEN_212948-1 [Araneus ventricosus]GBO05640.1 hypothetical protein AVEN_119966-1 [Araneus ventricosus]
MNEMECTDCYENVSSPRHSNGRCFGTGEQRIRDPIILKICRVWAACTLNRSLFSEVSSRPTNELRTKSGKPYKCQKAKILVNRKLFTLTKSPDALFNYLDKDYIRTV